MLKVGIDVDGVLASFVIALENLMIQMTGENKFPEYNGEDGPAVWNWPVYYGYTKEQMDAAFKHIATKNGFWINLPPMQGVEQLKKDWHKLYFDADVYFVTNRAGSSAKTETEYWLESNGIPRPTVLISADKGSIASALKLDAYIDDNFDNAVAVSTLSPGTKMFLLDRNYNRNQWVKASDGSDLLVPYGTPAGITRVPSVREFIERVDAHL